MTTKTTNTTAGSTRAATSRSAPPRSGRVFLHTATGRFHDEETGLYYFRRRHYDPEKGRFVQRDPLGYAPGPSLFEYAVSSPAVFRDPLGTDAYEDCKKRVQDCKDRTNKAFDAKIKRLKEKLKRLLEVPGERGRRQGTDEEAATEAGEQEMAMELELHEPITREQAAAQAAHFMHDLSDAPSAMVHGVVILNAWRAGVAAYQARLRAIQRVREEIEQAEADRRSALEACEEDCEALKCKDDKKGQFIHRSNDTGNSRAVDLIDLIVFALAALAATSALPGRRARPSRARTAPRRTAMRTVSGIAVVLWVLGGVRPAVGGTPEAEWSARVGRLQSGSSGATWEMLAAHGRSAEDAATRIRTAAQVYDDIDRALQNSDEWIAAHAEVIAPESTSAVRTYIDEMASVFSLLETAAHEDVWDPGMGATPAAYSPVPFPFGAVRVRLAIEPAWRATSVSMLLALGQALVVHTEHDILLRRRLVVDALLTARTLLVESPAVITDAELAEWRRSLEKIGREAIEDFKKVLVADRAAYVWAIEECRKGHADPLNHVISLNIEGTLARYAWRGESGACMFSDAPCNPNWCGSERLLTWGAEMLDRAEIGLSLIDREADMRVAALESGESVGRRVSLTFRRFAGFALEYLGVMRVGAARLRVEEARRHGGRVDTVGICAAVVGDLVDPFTGQPLTCRIAGSGDLVISVDEGEARKRVPGLAREENSGLEDALLAWRLP